MKEEKITNEEVSRRFGKINNITSAWRERKILFIGRIVRLKKDICPPILLTASVNGKRRQGCRFRIIHVSFVENTTTIMPEVDARGRVRDLIGCVTVSKE